MREAGVIRTAAIQFTAGPEIEENFSNIIAMIREAAKNGATLIMTPENTCHMRARMQEKLVSAPDETGAAGVSIFAALAKQLDVHILVGSLSIRQASGKLANRSYLFSPHDRAPITYDKIHLFDADFGDGRCYRESDVFQNGERAVVADVDGFKLGMSVCYDVRFPMLYRALAKGGAGIIAVPAAFVVETGAAHWHALLRARAIENGVYIVAPAQGGTHAGGRQTYGHSLIVDPWGEIIAEKTDDAPGIVYADITAAAIARARSSVLSLQHDRPFTVQYY